MGESWCKLKLVTAREGVLDGRELRKLVRDLAKATGVYLSVEQVNAEVAKCIQKFGDQRGVTEEGFARYAASEPGAFKALIMWREVFAKYASHEDEIQEADTVKLVLDVCVVNQHAITQSRAVSEAKELMQAANVSGKGSINFGEFVAYARKRPSLFGKLTSEVMNAVGGTNRRGASPAGDRARSRQDACSLPLERRSASSTSVTDDKGSSWPVSTPECLPSSSKLGLTEGKVLAAISAAPADSRCHLLSQLYEVHVRGLDQDHVHPSHSSNGLANSTR